MCGAGMSIFRKTDKSGHVQFGVNPISCRLFEEQRALVSGAASKTGDNLAEDHFYGLVAAVIRCMSRPKNRLHVFRLVDRKTMAAHAPCNELFARQSFRRVSRSYLLRL